MSRKVLVAYSTRYGSTGEVAQAIAKTLTDEGFDAEAAPAREIASVDGYHAVIVGGPFYYGAWSKEAKNFVEKQRTALESLPFALFALGPSSGEGEELREACEHFRQDLLSSVSLRPIAAEVFGGSYDPSRLGFLDRLATVLPASPLHGLPAQDARDWAAIAAWARSIMDKLR